MRGKLLLTALSMVALSASVYAQVTYKLSDYGLQPNNGQNASPVMAKAIEAIRQDAPKGERLIIELSPGHYNFYPEEATVREYYISNHDQVNPKKVGMAFENMENITFDGKGAELMFHGCMLPISVIGSKNCSFKNLSIDFRHPQIAQAEVMQNDTASGTLVLKLAPWVKYAIKEGKFHTQGEDWEITPSLAIAFEPETKRLVYNSSDVSMNMRNTSELSQGIIEIKGMKNKRLIQGTILAMRTYYRSAPGIFVANCLNTTLENIQVHYAHGMGLIAQMSENITLDKFSVCLRGGTDPRYFTTQADATHFSGCKGRIISKNGLYEGMMDDAINVHGTYLKIIKRINDKTLTARYMHLQAYGFDWGFAGDSVQFIKSKTMELINGTNTITSIVPTDKPEVKGAKEFEITFAKALSPEINELETLGIENLTWTPEVVFSHNTIRNNRARGALFSTPQKVLVTDNVFDHTSGTAVLLCGDCNGWYETGACRNVTIRNNQFINALTSMFQFTNAIISIYPEIPDLKNQQQYFHSGIVIENNVFETFDKPILYAKSVDGLIFRNNIIKRNKDYPAFHRNKNTFLLERVTNSDIKEHSN